MADSINELYAKYAEGVGGSLEEDRYFQYLFEMIQAGDNTLQQKNRVLHKVVDEQWLNVVEEGITAIFNIVDKPRRFITTSEEVVPVALAKKITADSVRHLSQNTQYINTNAAGEIQPTHILNVTTEESYDLYENRFVYHLIQRLFAFVDKRTDVIFWATGDETCNVMSMESKVDDAYEEISYKVEMTIKNRQSLVENDEDNMDIFKRIDRVRRLSRTLRTSSFCDLMNGCARVRSPIQRTNLMMKDPDYRKCYQLWQFIESYDEVGYTIEERDTALQFDEEYLLQMYTNMITNYTVFKSLLESDPRKMTEIAEEKREPVKPKFIKEIKEEEVEDRNLPDVEIRRVFVEEVTQAQLDAEAKLEEETVKNEKLEESMASLQSQMDSLSQQLKQLEQLKAQTEQEKQELEEELAETRNAKREIRVALDKAQEETKSAVRMTEKANKEAAEAKKRAFAARKETEEIRQSAEQEVAEAKEQAARAIRDIRSQAAKDVTDAEIQAAKDMDQAQKAAEDKVKSVEQEADRTVKAIQHTAAEEIASVKETTDAEIKAVKAEAAQEADRAIKVAEQEADKAVSEAKQSADAAIAEVKKATSDEIATIHKDAEKQIAAIRKDAEHEIEHAKQEAADAVQRMLDAEKEKEKAIAKAEANSLSRYIVQTLQERRDRKQTKEDDEK